MLVHDESRYQDISFESKYFNPLVEETEISEADKIALIKVFDFIYNVHNHLVEHKEKKIAKKLYTETHMVSLVPFVKRAIQDDIDDWMFAGWLITFFISNDGASVSADYNEAAGSGSAKAFNIMARNEALAESYAEYFKADTIDTINEDDTVESNEDFDSDDSEDIVIPF